MEIIKKTDFIIDNVGGIENILQVEHCATRIRIKLLHYSKINQFALNNSDFIKASFITNGVYQIVMDSDAVSLVYCNIKSLLDKVNSDNISYYQTAKSLIELFGGQENILSIEYCSTRIRVQLDNVDLLSKDEIENLDLVNGVYINNNLCQVVMSFNYIKSIYKNISELIDIPVYAENKKFSKLKRIVKRITKLN